MHIPHELSDEFPDEKVLIARLAKTNYLFRRTASRYDAVNRQIFRIESRGRANHRRGPRKSQEGAPQAQRPDCPHAHQDRTPDVEPSGCVCKEGQDGG